MNIDLRNIDEDFENAVLKIIQNDSLIKTNSKAVRLAVVSYDALKFRLDLAEKELKKIEKENITIKDDIDNYFAYKERLIKHRKNMLSF